MQGAARPGLLVDLQQDGNDAAEPDHFAVRRSLSSNSVSLCPCVRNTATVLGMSARDVRCTD